MVQGEKSSAESGDSARDPIRRNDAKEALAEEGSDVAAAAGLLHGEVGNPVAADHEEKMHSAVALFGERGEPREDCGAAMGFPMMEDLKQNDRKGGDSAPMAELRVAW